MYNTATMDVQDIIRPSTPLFSHKLNTTVYKQYLDDRMYHYGTELALVRLHNQYVDDIYLLSIKPFSTDQ